MRRAAARTSTGERAAFLGLAYLLALALSGHAATVPQMVLTAVLLDWLHLVAMAVWIGGMAAIALLLVPAHGGAHELLGAAGSLLAGGLPGAADRRGDGHVQRPGAHLRPGCTSSATLYGRLLLIKLAPDRRRIMAFSASHVFVTRPRLRASPGSAYEPRGPAYARDSRWRRLRLEPVLGALVLLCVALMGQVAPERLGLRRHGGADRRRSGQ